MFRSAVVQAILLASSLAHAQVDGEFHRFTDKKGQQILAMLLGVSEDKRFMKIRREDGQEFETQINVLSLDDQQFIKDWLDDRPVNTDFRLEVTSSRKSIEDLEYKESSYNCEKRFSTYEITVKNLSRDVLESAKIEYAIVWEDLIRVYQLETGEWYYRSTRYEESPVVRILQETDLEPVAFNREVKVETVPFEINRITYTGNQVLEEDRPMGLVARVVVAGKVIAEHRLNVETAAYPWERIVDLSEPEVVD